MKLKSPTDKPVSVALLSSHCMVIGPEGREVDSIFMAEALKLGCLPMGVNAEDLKTEPGKSGKEKHELILDGVKTLLEQGAKLTGAGMPDCRDLSKLVGFQVTKVEMSEAWAKLEEEAKEADADLDKDKEDF